MSSQSHKQFFGLLIKIGLNFKPEIRLYWLTNILYLMLFFYDCVMAANKSFEIFRFLPIVNNNKTKNNPVNTQHLPWKIRPFEDELLSKFKTMFCWEQLNLDAATCPCKG